MSAITGIYQINEEPINLQHAQILLKQLKKYPANDIQTWHKDNVFLGCHAQWITPESIGEQLPYYDYERQLAITADAIIDNRDELFEKLQVDRAKRKSITDSELILLSYQNWGEDAPKYFVGDFAFMIWDEKNQQFFGARDSSGYRTLYYYQDQSRFAFCTIIEPLLCLPYIERQLNELWLAEFLAISGMTDSVDARMTPYSKIDQVPPFHTITIARDKKKLTRFGTFFSEKKLKLKSNEEYVQAFQDVFQKAVNSRLRTNRKIGSHLSGGLDSGAVVGFAAKTMREENKILHTFSYIPPSDFIDFTPNFFMPDERPFIKKTVQSVGGISDHYYDFEGRNSYLEIDDILETMEMPYKFIENSFWLKGIFEKAHENGVGVLLNGDKGNFSVSWGSALDYYSVLLKKLKWFRLFQELNQYNRNVGGPRLKKLNYITRLGFPILDNILPKPAGDELPRLINPTFAERTDIFKKLTEHGMDQTGWFSSTNLFEQRKILFEDMVPWNSGHTFDCKLSLRYSLWKRDPTNDIRVVRFCLSIPEEQYVQNGFDRSLIRRSTENILPDSVRLNQRKRGIQGADWVHRMIPCWDEFIKEVKQLSKDPQILEFIDSQMLHSALKMGEEGPKPEYFNHTHYSFLLRTLVVGRFLKKFT